jgi:hypothetical protein
MGRIKVVQYIMGYETLFDVAQMTKWATNKKKEQQE